ncbi:glycoside hydrolase family 76 protein, partial [Piedraia hortae CBS 480.64]
ATAQAAITLENAESAYTALQTFYNYDTGIWSPSTGWWNSANCLTTITNLAALSSNLRPNITSIIANTYSRASASSMQVLKVLSDTDDLPHCHYGNPSTPAPETTTTTTNTTAQSTTSDFLNDYYDDEGWWALAWIAAYDLTGRTSYLSTAESIFEDMAASWSTTPCGGIWWDKKHTYVNAIANELFFSIAAHLSNRLNHSYYLTWALKSWSWFQNSGLINEQGTINDGLNSDCENNGKTVWSYNQGVVLGGLVELAKATGDTTYLDHAQEIATAAVSALTDGVGVLVEACEPDSCGGDGSQFKGIFVRNVGVLEAVQGEGRFAPFLERNAEEVWKNRQQEGDFLGLQWGEPAQGVNASTQSSAMDVLVAATKV